MQQTKAKDLGLGSFIRRNKDMENLRSYISNIIEQENPTYFMFVDDSFMARPTNELEEFCRMYDEFKIPFWFNTRPENVSVEKLQMLKEVNCNRIAYGVECGNEEFRSRVLLRKMTNKLLINKFKIIAESGIAFSVNNIVGFPGETRELIFESIRLIKQISGYDSLSVTVFVPYNGTVLRDVCLSEGLIFPDLIIRDMLHTTLNMSQLSSHEINALARTFPLYVHFDESEWDNIKKAEENSSEGVSIFNHYADIYRRENFELNQDEKILEDKPDFLINTSIPIEYRIGQN